MPRQRRARRATHAGTWYSNDADALSSQIRGWLDAVPAPQNGHIQAIIAPHAGYRYSGHVMAHAYKYLNAQTVSRIFLLGPSHHVYAQACMLSKSASYSTPLGEIPIDVEVYTHLLQSGDFEYMPTQVDEAEHSLELHLPYIAHIMKGREYTLVPIMVGALGIDGEERFGEILAPYFNDSQNFFVISSDFCHWGLRFSYTFYDPSKGDISDSTKWLDLQGMEAISKGSPESFRNYMRLYNNTICGRHPIALLLQMIAYSKAAWQVQLKHYDQSSKCSSRADSSVSYIAAAVSQRMNQPAS